MYINTETLEYPVSEQEIKNRHPNISFSDVFSPPPPYAPVKPETPKPVDYEPYIWKPVELAPAQTPKGWQQRWEIVPRFTEYTDEDGVLHTVEEQINEARVQRDNNEWANVRVKRDKLLLNSDYTQVPDYPLPLEVKEAWRAYRQSLRDITEQEDPFNIEWPKAPDESAISLLDTDWEGFNFSLFTDPDFVQYGILAQSVNPYLVPSIIERYSRISDVGLEQSRFADYWESFCSSLSVTPEHREQWAQLAEENSLPPDLVDVIRGV